MVRLPERAIILPSCTKMAPTGTSPAAADARASSSACSMNPMSVLMLREHITRLLDNSRSGTETTPRERQKKKGAAEQFSNGLRGAAMEFESVDAARVALNR